MKKMVYGPKRTDSPEILYQGTYRDYQFYIVSLVTHPTAYVRVNLTKNQAEKIDVHGGITFQNQLCELSWWDSNDTDCEAIGWDYAHAGDYYGGDKAFECLFKSRGKKWTTKEILKDVYSVIDQIIDHISKMSLTSEEALGYLNDIAHGRKMDLDAQDLKEIVAKDLEVLRIIKRRNINVEDLRIFNTFSSFNQRRSLIGLSLITKEEFKLLQRWIEQ